MPQLRKPPQQDAKSFQPFRNALGVIHAIHTKHNEVVGQLTTQLRRQCFNVTASGMPCKLLKRDTDRECGHPRAPIIQRNDVMGLFSGPGSLGNDSLQAAQEVVSVALGLESQQMILQQGTQNRFPPR